MKIEGSFSKDGQLEFIFEPIYLGFLRIYFEIPDRDGGIYCEIEADEKYKIVGFEKLSKHNIKKNTKDWVFHNLQIEEVEKICPITEIQQILISEYNSYKYRNGFISKMFLEELKDLSFEEARKELKKHLEQGKNFYKKYLFENSNLQNCEDEEIFLKFEALKDDFKYGVLKTDFCFRVSSHFIAIGNLCLALRAISGIESDEINSLRSQIVGSICNKGISEIPAGNAEDIIVKLAELKIDKRHDFIIAILSVLVVRLIAGYVIYYFFLEKKSLVCACGCVEFRIRIPDL